jgi:hypothetical protein
MKIGVFFGGTTTLRSKRLHGFKTIVFMKNRDFNLPAGVFSLNWKRFNGANCSLFRNTIVKQLT